MILSSIVGGVYEQKALWTNVCADDWTAERAIIASNYDNKGELVYLGINVWASCDSGCSLVLNAIESSSNETLFYKFIAENGRILPKLYKRIQDQLNFNLIIHHTKYFFLHNKKLVVKQSFICFPNQWGRGSHIMTRFCKLSQILQNSLNLKINVFQGIPTDKFLASKYFAVTKKTLAKLEVGSRIPGEIWPSVRNIRCGKERPKRQTDRTCLKTSSDS